MCAPGAGLESIARLIAAAASAWRILAMAMIRIDPGSAQSHGLRAVCVAWRALQGWEDREMAYLAVQSSEPVGAITAPAGSSGRWAI